MHDVIHAVLGNFDSLYFLMIIAGAAGGMIVGALPGFTATMGVAIFVPFTYYMSTNSAMAFLIALYCAAVYSGSIPAILIRTPGTPAAIATINDGYPMAQKGFAGKALGIASYASVLGGIISVVILALTSGVLAKAALKFGPQEYFALTLLGLSMVVGMSEGDPTKGFVSMFLGLVITLPGLTVNSGYPRFVFGNDNLLSGIELLPVMIGVFAISEVLHGIVHAQESKPVKQSIDGIVGSIRFFKGKTFLTIKSSFIGTFLGALPGVGAVTAAFMGYNEAQRTSKHPELMGSGTEEGIIGPEAANNGVTGGAMIPLLSLGIPGDAVTAILLGALMVQGVRPGPELFSKNLDVVYGIYSSMIISYIAILVLSMCFIRILVRVIEVPSRLLYPFIIVFCLIGSYALRGSFFDVGVAIIFGLIGYIMRENRFPIGPMTLAIILGSLMEYKLTIALSLSRGNWLTFINRPISGLIILATIVFLVVSFLKEIKNRRRKSKSLTS